MSGPTASIPALPEDSADKLVVRERLVEELDLKISPLRDRLVAESEYSH